MPFDQSSVRDVAVTRRGADLAVSWVSTAPAGTVFQVYVDRAPAWHGTARSCSVPYPGAAVRVEVGAVAGSEVHADFGANLPVPAGGGNRIEVVWQGGTFLGDCVGFRVYTGTVPGGAVDYGRPRAVVTAYPGGVVADGFGVGPYGGGGFGRAAGTFRWVSGPVAPGSWAVAVVPVDAAGNPGPALAATATVAGPPRPPARDAAGARVRYTWNPGAGGTFGAGGFGAGGFGTGAGFGLGGFGGGGYGEGEGPARPFVTLAWNASPPW